VFDDPFFDSFMGGGSQRKKLTATGKPVKINVLPLPTEGRPADFSGAIGKFSLTAKANPVNVAVGDPISLTTVVSGRGNFDRVAVPPLASDQDWKTYATSSKFEPSDALGTAGKKSFEQAIIPQRADLPAIPPRSFSYFDPEARRYATVSTERIALLMPQSHGATTAKGGGAADRNAAGAATSTSAERRTEEAASGFELAPNQIALGELRRPGPPLARRPGFLAAQLVPIVAAALVVGWIRRRERLARDPLHLRQRAAQRAIDEQVREMRRAVGANDGGRFFAAARRAVQESVAPSDGEAAALTLAEIELALGRSGSSARDGAAPASPLVERVREVFHAADAATYSGQHPSGTELEAWQQRVLALLAELRSAR
jgi:hypothetical protein